MTSLTTLTAEELLNEMDANRFGGKEQAILRNAARTELLRRLEIGKQVWAGGCGISREGLSVRIDREESMSKEEHESWEGQATYMHFIKLACPDCAEGKSTALRFGERWHDGCEPRESSRRPNEANAHRCRAWRIWQEYESLLPNGK